MRVDSLVWVPDARDPAAPTAAEIVAGVRIELAPAPQSPRVRPLHIHVTTGVCELKHCGWSGFHFHWRHRRYRTAFAGAMTQTELREFDADCQALNVHRRSLRKEVIPDD